MKPELVIPDDETMIRGDACLTLGIPWMVPDAIKWLHNTLTEQDHVCEFGMGGSTVFFAQRCASVLSVETNPLFMNVVSDELERWGLHEKCKSWSFNLEEDIIKWCGYGMAKYFNRSSVLSIDTQGGYNRSAILNAVMNTKPQWLQIVILDNFAHPELFPEDHQQLFLDWKVLDFVHHRWAGNGTRIYVHPDRLKIGFR